MNLRYIVFLGVCFALGLGGAPAAEGAAQNASDGLACTAEVSWIGLDEAQGLAAGGRAPTVVQMLVHISRPARCLGAGIALTAAYLDSEGRVLCTGAIDQIALLRRHVQSVAIEINPTVLRTFARWRNEPGRRFDPPFTPMQCFGSDGRTEMLDLHLDSASSLHLTATILPAWGGVATAEARIRLTP